jgi:hypothetical protein
MSDSDIMKFSESVLTTQFNVNNQSKIEYNILNTETGNSFSYSTMIYQKPIPADQVTTFTADIFAGSASYKSCVCWTIKGLIVNTGESTKLTAYERKEVFRVVDPTEDFLIDLWDVFPTAENSTLSFNAASFGSNASVTNIQWKCLVQTLSWQL